MRLLAAMARTLGGLADGLKLVSGALAEEAARPSVRRSRRENGRVNGSSQARDGERRKIDHAPEASSPPAYWIERLGEGGPPAHWLERVRGTGLGQGAGSSAVGDGIQILEAPPLSDHVEASGQVSDNKAPNVPGPIPLRTPSRQRQVGERREGQASQPQGVANAVRAEYEVAAGVTKQQKSRSTEQTQEVTAAPIREARERVTDQGQHVRASAATSAGGGESVQARPPTRNDRIETEPVAQTETTRANVTYSDRRTNRTVREDGRGIERHVGYEQAQSPAKERAVPNRSNPATHRMGVEQNAIYIDTRFPELSARPHESLWPALPTPDWRDDGRDGPGGSAWDMEHLERLEGEQRRMLGAREA